MALRTASTTAATCLFIQGGEHPPLAWHTLNPDARPHGTTTAGWTFDADACLRSIYTMRDLYRQRRATGRRRCYQVTQWNTLMYHGTGHADNALNVRSGLLTPDFESCMCQHLLNKCNRPKRFHSSSLLIFFLYFRYLQYVATNCYRLNKK